MEIFGFTLPDLLGSKSPLAGSEPADYSLGSPGYIPTKDYRPTAGVSNPDNPLLYAPLAAAPTPTEILAPDFSEQESTVSLSDLWNKFELAISPESEGEHIVNQIYRYDDAVNPLTPPDDKVGQSERSKIGLPHFVVATGTAIKN